MMLQESAHVNGRGLRPLRNADLAPLEVTGAADSAFSIL
jgi:hypothetical protein